MVQLKILHINVNSIYSKIDELRYLVTREKYDIISLNETKLDPNRKPPHIQGYQVFYENRTNRGGGVACYYAENLPAYQKQVNSKFEIIAIQIQGACIITTYNPGNFKISQEDFEELFELDDRTIIIGDLNCRNTVWGDKNSNRNGQKLLKIVDQLEVQLDIPDEPTYYTKKSNSILDIAISKNIQVTNMEVLQEIDSDHRPVEITINTETQLSEKKNKKYKNYKKADWTKFRKTLQEKIQLKRDLKTPDEIDRTIAEITKIIQAAQEEAIPNFKNTIEDIPPEITNLIRERNTARRQVQRNPTEGNKQALENAKRKLKQTIFQVNNKKWENRIKTESQNKGNVWRLTKFRKNPTTKLTPALRTEGSVPKFKDEDKAELLAETFANHHTLTINLGNRETEQQVNEYIQEFENTQTTTPTNEYPSIHEIRRIIKSTKPYKAPGHDDIQYAVLKKMPKKALIQIFEIYKACFKIQHFPNTWKIAIIAPIKKPNKPSFLATSYRPISLLPTLGKILEKLMLNRLKDLDEKLKENQFGFRPARNTELQLAKIINEITNNRNKKLTTAMATIDIEKAYDTVWHDGLLYKLNKQDCPKYLLKMIEKFLKNREFTTTVNNKKSNIKNIPAGVPQGSSLSPTLFIHYLHDIPESNEAEVYLFADDTAITTKSMNEDRSIQLLQKHIDTTSDFFRKWKLKINADKSTYITFNSKMKNPTETLFYEDTIIPYSKNVKYLGVTLDKKLNFNLHTKITNDKAKMAAYYVWPFISENTNLEQKQKINLIRAYVRATIIYAAPVWSSTCLSNMGKLVITENKCLRRTLNKKSHEITNKNLWKKTKWKPLIKTIYDKTKNFYNNKIQNTPSTNHIGKENNENYKHKTRGKWIHQMLLDNDITA